MHILIRSTPVEPALPRPLSRRLSIEKYLYALQQHSILLFVASFFVPLFAKTYPTMITRFQTGLSHNRRYDIFQESRAEITLNRITGNQEDTLAV
jgi:hypothetical protein